MTRAVQGGLGPMQGQADWWVLFAPDTDDFAIERYRKETQRLFGVMDRYGAGGDNL